MEFNEKHPSCNILGRGVVYKNTKDKKDKFKIIDMSAEYIRIKIDQSLELNSIINLSVKISVGILEMDVNAQGEVVEKLEQARGYKIKFIRLSDKDQKNIDEIMRASCNIED